MIDLILRMSRIQNWLVKRDSEFDHLGGVFIDLIKPRMSSFLSNKLDI